MVKQLAGWAVLAIGLAWPFNKLYFQMEQISNFEKALYLVLTLVFLGIGYVMIGNAKEASKESH